MTHVYPDQLESEEKKMLDQVAPLFVEIGLDQIGLGKMVWMKLSDEQPLLMAKPADGVETNDDIIENFVPAFVLGSPLIPARDLHPAQPGIADKG